MRREATQQGGELSCFLQSFANRFGHFFGFLNNIFDFFLDFLAEAFERGLDVVANFFAIFGVLVDILEQFLLYHREQTQAGEECLVGEFEWNGDYAVFQFLKYRFRGCFFVNYFLCGPFLSPMRQLALRSF